MEQLNLSNEDRKYLGLTPIGENWETMRINDNTLYFDGDIIRKMIMHNYSETWGYSYSDLEECIKVGSNLPYFAKDNYDLRNPKNAKDKEEIFKLFGLDASLDYAGNLNLAGKK